MGNMGHMPVRIQGGGFAYEGSNSITMRMGLRELQGPEAPGTAAEPFAAPSCLGTGCYGSLKGVLGKVSSRPGALTLC